MRNLSLLLASNALASIGTGIAMIAVPWILVSEPDGATRFGILVTITNLVLFLVVPAVGVQIDLHSRRTMMIALRVFFVFFLVCFVAIDQLAAEYGREFILVCYYFVGSLFYVVNVPLRTALVKELFEGREHRRVNAILEIENQISAVVTGAITIYIADTINITLVSLLNILAYVIAISYIAELPRTVNHTAFARKNFISDALFGFRRLMRDKAVGLMLSCSCIPYVCVILYNYLHPVLLSWLSTRSAGSYALVELLFACGAICGGLLLMGSRAHNHVFHLLAFSMVLFAGVAVIQALFPTYHLIIALAAAFGLGNALVRVLRQSVLMTTSPTDEIGRIGAALQSFIMLSRTILFAIVTFASSQFGPVAGAWLVGLAATIAAILVFLAFQALVTRARSNTSVPT